MPHVYYVDTTKCFVEPKSWSSYGSCYIAIGKRSQIMRIIPPHQTNVIVLSLPELHARVAHARRRNESRQQSSAAGKPCLGSQLVGGTGPAELQHWCELGRLILHIQDCRQSLHPDHLMNPRRTEGYEGRNCNGAHTCSPRVCVGG